MINKKEEKEILLSNNEHSISCRLVKKKEVSIALSGALQIDSKIIECSRKSENKRITKRKDV